MSGDAKTLIETAARRFVEEVPALAPMKLVVGVELHGRGDVQHFRLQMPEAQVTKGPADDARINVEMRREFFNIMATEGKVPDWIEAFTYGKAKATGPTPVPEADLDRRGQAPGTRTPEERPQALLRSKNNASARRRRLVVSQDLLRQKCQRGQHEDAHHDQ